jgi:uncharacterized protein (TIGR02300 family)
VVRPELGTKRQCQSCGTKFYDLAKDPILCPKCHAVFQVTAPLAVLARDDDEDNVVDPVNAELISLDDVAAGENGKDVIVDDDLDLGDDIDDDDTFLEEEEDDNDNVSDLIDGDLDKDDES